MKMGIWTRVKSKSHSRTDEWILGDHFCGGSICHDTLICQESDGDKSFEPKTKIIDEFNDNNNNSNSC